MKHDQMFAEKVLGILLPHTPDAVFHSYEEVTKAGGPSSTALVRLHKIAQGKLSITQPRKDLCRSLDVALAKAEKRNIEHGYAISLWDGILDNTVAESSPPEINQELEQLKIELNSIRRDVIGLLAKIEDLAERLE